MGMLNAPSEGILVGLISSSLWFFVLMRFGLVAAAFMIFGAQIAGRFPTTLDASAWYSGYGYLALAIFAVIVLYAFRTSLGGRPLLAPSHLDD